jgi:hypothetical protein
VLSSLVVPAEQQVSEVVSQLQQQYGARRVVVSRHVWRLEG